MRIGIDISQVVYEGSGVARYVRELVTALVKHDNINSYIFFGASLRKQDTVRKFIQELQGYNKKICFVLLPLPPTILDIVWNQWGICPIEWFVGPIDVFWSSDWTQPPLRHAKGVTTIHDVSFLRYPESFDTTIVSVQKRRLAQAKKQCLLFLCDSIATQKDVVSFLEIDVTQTRVIYPGVSL